MKGPSDDAAFFLLLIVEEVLQLPPVRSVYETHKMPTLASAKKFSSSIYCRYGPYMAVKFIER